MSLTRALSKSGCSSDPLQWHYEVFFRGFSLVIRSFSDVWLVDASTDVIYIGPIIDVYTYEAAYDQVSDELLPDACHQGFSDTTV